MNAIQAIRASMDLGLMVLTMYTSDFADADLMLRPTNGCNHTAWQLGHLIASEVSMVNGVCPGKAAALPDGFAERHSKEQATCDDASQFCSKQTYLELFQQVRAATVAALEGLSDADLDAPSPAHFRDNFPTVGHVFNLIGSHPMMHAGQIAVVRRQLGKPILI